MYFLPEGEWTNSGEYRCSACPICDKDKFFFNPDSELGHCKNSACELNEHGIFGFGKLKSLYGNAASAHTQRINRAGSGRKTSREAKGLDTPGLRVKHAWDNELGREFLESRGVKETVSRALPIWWNDAKAAMVVDIEPVSPEYPAAILYRMLTVPNHKWIPTEGTDKQHYIWGYKFWKTKNQELKQDGKQPFVILVEGIMDIVSSGLLGHSIAMLGSEISSSVALFLANLKCPIYLWSDPDEAGKKAHKKVSSTLLSWGVECVILDGEKDSRFNVDPKNCSSAVVKELITELASS